MQTWVNINDVLVPQSISLTDWIGAQSGPDVDDFLETEAGTGKIVVQTDVAKVGDRLAKLATLELLLVKAAKILQPDYECGMEGVCDMLQELVNVE